MSTGTAVAQGAASGAATGAAIGTAAIPIPGIGTAIGAGAGALVGGVAGYLGSANERKLQREIKADTLRMAGGGGGMSQGKLQSAQASGMGLMNAQQQQALAQLARGSSLSGGDSGSQQTRQAAVFQGGMQAGQQVQSKIREQDLAYAQQQRELNRQLRAGFANLDAQRMQDTYQSLQQLGATTASLDAAQTARMEGQVKRAEAAKRLAELGY